MKKIVMLSLIAAFNLVTINAQGLDDSVAKKEQEVLKNPKVVNTKAAQAKVQESQSKLEFKAKMDASKFNKEALKDRDAMLHYAVTKEANYEKSTFKLATKDINNAFNKTIDAIEALKKSNIAVAKKDLDEASKLFEAALKRDSKLKLVPIANTIEIKVFKGDSKLIKTLLDKAETEIKNRNTQVARAIVMPLQDEMDILNIYIPIEIYSVAVKKASDELDKNNIANAINILMQGLNAKVINAKIIPIPLLIAQDLVTTASKIDKNKKELAIAILDAAKEELQKAYLLGYTNKHSAAYKALNEQINTIKKEIKGKNRVEKLYEKIKNAFVNLVKDTRADIKEDIAKHKIDKYQEEQLKKAIKEKDLFKKDALKDLNKTVK